MRTNLHPDVLATARGRRADEILRSCVHCGFCTATCPTYLETGDELDGPRGRIYLINAVLEENRGNAAAQQHLDRCLTCRSCETTCPSGVAYGELLDFGREVIERSVPRPAPRRWLRRLLRLSVPRPGLLKPVFRLAQAARPLLPGRLKTATAAARRRHYRVPAPSVAATGRRVLLLSGCVQSYATPNTVAAARAVLAHLGVAADIAPPACCGALEHHLGDPAAAARRARANLSSWQSRGVAYDAILSLASGCGVHIKDYPRLLAESEPGPAAAGFAGKVEDIGEYLASLDVSVLPRPQRAARVAWHAPCTLQHGQRTGAEIPGMLAALGYLLVPAGQGHLCCGSAGAYSLEQPQLSRALRDRKLAALGQNGPEVIATANVGCQLHLQSATPLPVRHWIELLAAGLTADGPVGGA
jgi:glycolate oxidase iron-sulfur subunit